MSDIKKAGKGYRFDINGWNYVHIEGGPLERGKSYGQLCAKLIEKEISNARHNCYEDTGMRWDFFLAASNKYFLPPTKKNYPEQYKEMEGIAAGCVAAGFKTTVQEILLWNNVMGVVEYWYPNIYLSDPSKEPVSMAMPRRSFRKMGGGSLGKCSAFIAVGEGVTADGKIVLAHNTFDNFTSGQGCHMILSVKPDKGFNILMQTTPGWVWSGADFFVTSAGIMGSETTIGGFLPFKNGNPCSARIRKAMQYGKDFQFYEKCLLDGNTGGYANSWVFGDISKNTIHRIELGLKYHNSETKSSGYFIGFNGTYDPKIRNLECNNQGFFDIRRHEGARHVRLTQLMEYYKGKLDVATGKKILADHYDIYEGRINPCSRTVDSHYELDNRAYMSQADRPKPFQPRGALDGKVVDSAMTAAMSFWGIWGNSSGMPFDPVKFCNANIQWMSKLPYLDARPSQPWTSFALDQGTAAKSKTTPNAYGGWQRADVQGLRTASVTSQTRKKTRKGGGRRTRRRSAR